MYLLLNKASYLGHPESKNLPTFKSLHLHEISDPPNPKNVRSLSSNSNENAIPLTQVNPAMKL